MSNYVISFAEAYSKTERRPVRERLPGIPDDYWLGDEIVVEVDLALPDGERLFPDGLFLKSNVSYHPNLTYFRKSCPDDFNPMFIADRDEWDDLREEIRRACFAAFIDSYTTAENMEEALRLKNGEGDFTKFAKLAGLTYERFNRARLWLPDGGKGVPEMAPPRGPDDLQIASDYDEANLPKREWIVEGLVHRKLMSLLIASGGSGKSTFLQQIGMAVAAGRDFGPFRTLKRANVLIMNREDDTVEQQKRQSAARRAMGISPEELDGRLFYWNPNTAPLVSATIEDGIRTVGEHTWAKELRTMLTRENIGLLILDPLIKFHRSLDENSNDDRERIARAALSIAEDGNVAVLISHHAHKGARADQDASRGGSALMDAARAAYVMQANDDGVVEMTCVKLTMGRRQEASQWKFVEYELANGEFAAALKPLAVDPFCDEFKSVILDLVASGRPNGQGWCSARNAALESRLDPVLEQRFDLAKGNGLEILDKYVEAGLIAQKDIKAKRLNGAGTMPVSVWTVCDAVPPAPAAEPKTQAAVVPSL
jgi:hypothetical protein